MKKDKLFEKQIFDIFQPLFKANSEIKNIGFWVNQYGVNTEDIGINGNNLDHYLSDMYDTKLEKARALLDEIKNDEDDISASLIIPLEKIVKAYDGISITPIVENVYDFNFASHEKKIEKLISNYLGKRYPFHKLENGVYFSIDSDGSVKYEDD